MFAQTSGALMALSICLSLRTIWFISLRIISMRKTLLRFKTKLLLMVWVVVSTTKTIMANVLFFTPSFGLFHILGHWKLEQTPYSREINDRFRNNNTVYLYNSKPVSWTDLNRWDYNTDSGPDYTVYTYFSLKQYFCGYWILLLLQIGIHALIKIVCSHDFRTNPKNSILFKFIHCLENTSVPTVWEDWDEKKDYSIANHKKRHGVVVKKMVAIMTIRTVFHAVMVAPIVYTGMK